MLAVVSSSTLAKARYPFTATETISHWLAGLANWAITLKITGHAAKKSLSCLGAAPAKKALS